MIETLMLLIGTAAVLVVPAFGLMRIARQIWAERNER